MTDVTIRADGPEDGDSATKNGTYQKPTLTKHEGLVDITSYSPSVQLSPVPAPKDA